MTDRAEFRAVLQHLSSAVLVSSRMPDQVFRPNYTEFHFLEFDLFSSDGFWEMLQRLMEESRDHKVTLMVLDPDPERYILKEFGSFGVSHVPKSASAQQYLNAFQVDPGRPCYLMEISEVMVWFPPSLQWLIWGERGVEIMVLAYEETFHSTAQGEHVGRAIRRLTAEDALEISSPAWRNRGARARFARKLIDNYSEGQPWTDSAPDRALAVAHKLVAGEIGVIEASRNLSSLRWEFDAPQADLFLPFVAIDSETDELPIGSVRREWSKDALAQKDAEIERNEQAYRPAAIKACKSLIDQLRPSEE